MMGQLTEKAQLGAGVAGVALCGTSGPPPWTATFGRWLAHLERLRVGRRGHSRLLEWLAFGTHSFEWLSRDTAEVDAYRADPRARVDVLGQRNARARKRRTQRSEGPCPGTHRVSAAGQQQHRQAERQPLLMVSGRQALQAADQIDPRLHARRKAARPR